MIIIKNKLIYSQGFSLLEVLLSAALSITLCFIVCYSYLTVRRIYQLNINLNEMQNTAYFAERTLEQDIRAAGFIGCIKLTSDLMMQHPPGIEFTVKDILQGFKSDQLPSVMQSIAKDIVPGTDIIVVKKMSFQLMSLKSAMKHTSYSKNEFLIASDCNQARVVRYSTAMLSNEKDNFSNIAQVAPAEKIIYFIGNTGRKSPSGEPTYALYRKNLWGVKSQQTEIIDGIENMQFRYGMKSVISNNKLTYLSSSQVTDWSKIVLVKIDLLLISKGDVNYINQPYQFMGEKLTAPDRRLRREWIAIVALRER